MAALPDVNNMDWVPTMNLSDRAGSKSEILRCSVEDCVVSNRGGRQCSFYRISRETTSGELKKISDEKLSVWLKVLRLRNEVAATCKYSYVCHAHYIIDMSATLRRSSITEMIDSDSDEGSTVTDKKLATNTENVRRILLNSNNRVSKPMPPNRQSSISTTQRLTFTKSGNILRNESGNFSFLCGYCSAVDDDCYEMMNHINTHFVTQSGTLVPPPPSPEFVNCTITRDGRNKLKISETSRKVTNSMLKPKPPDKGMVFPRSTAASEHISPLKRHSSSTVNVKDLVGSRPCKIQRLQPIVDSRRTAESTTVPDKPDKFKLIRVQPLPLEVGQKFKKTLPEWCFEKDSKIVIKNPDTTDKDNVIVQSTSPVDSYQPKIDTNKNPNTTSRDNATVQSTSPVDSYQPKIDTNKNPNTTDKTNFTIHPKSAEDFSQALFYLCHPDALKCHQCHLEPVVGESEPRQHNCRECRTPFSNHISYRTHFLDRHRDLAPKCYQCESEPPISDASDPRRHKCAICKDWLTSHVDFRTHLKDAHNEHVEDNDFNYFANDCKEFSCYICEKNFKQRDYLLYHVKDHFEKNLKRQCHLCGLRAFRSEAMLRQHIKKTHDDDSPSNCDLCDKTFTNSWRMRQHRLSHTEELNHTCSICSKAFKLRKYLNRHMAVHNEVKIACRYCDAMFTFSTGRRAHEKSVHNVF